MEEINLHEILREMENTASWMDCGTEDECAKSERCWIGLKEARCENCGKRFEYRPGYAWQKKGKCRKMFCGYNCMRRWEAEQKKKRKPKRRKSLQEKLAYVTACIEKERIELEEEGIDAKQRRKLREKWGRHKRRMAELLEEMENERRENDGARGDSHCHGGSGTI